MEKLLEKKEKEWEEKRKRQEFETYPQRLRQNYPDLNEICSEENLDYLDYHYPEVAKPLSMLPDGYEKWEGIYKAVKRFMPNKVSNQEMKRTERNLSKPVALSRPGMTQTGDHAPSLFLTEEQRKKNWERMQRVMKSGS